MKLGLIAIYSQFNHSFLITPSSYVIYTQNNSWEFPALCLGYSFDSGKWQMDI